MLVVFLVNLLLDSSHHYENALHNFDDHGISIGSKIKLDLDKMMSRKSSVVVSKQQRLNLNEQNEVTVFNGLSFNLKTQLQLKLKTMVNPKL